MPRAGFLFALAAASLAARFAIAARPLWFDEVFTLWAARLPLSELLAALRSDSGPPGFYLLEGPFVWIAESIGNDRFARALPFLAILMLYAALRTLPRGKARPVLVALLASSLLLNLYAGEARAYALLALADLALFLAALHGRETPARLYAVAAAGALALYTHSLAILAVAAVFLLAAAARRWKTCAALGVSAALFAPWVPVLLGQPAQALAWMREPAGRSVLGFLSALGGVGRVPGPFGAEAPRPLFLAGAAVGLLLAALLLRSARGDRETAEAAIFVGIVLALALLAGLVRPIAFAGRTEMAVLPVWLWGVSRAAAENRAAHRTAGAAALCGALATVLFLLSPHQSPPPVEIAESLARVGRRGDIVLASTAFYLPARLASDRGALDAEVRSLPEELARHPGWFVPELPGPAEEAGIAQAARALPAGGRLFLALAPPYQTPGLTAAIAALGGSSRELTRGADALVLLWTPAPDSR